MARSRLQTVLQDEDGDIVPNQALTVLETDGTTPVAQTLYTAASGGSVITTPTTNSLGYFEAYSDLPQRAILSVAGAGTLPIDLAPDPADVTLKTATQTLTNKTLTAPTLTAPTATGGMTVAHNSASPALTVQNTDAGSYSLLAKNAAGDEVFKVVRTGTNDCVAINLQNGIAPATSSFVVAKSVTSGSGFVMADFDLATSSGDCGAIRALTHQSVAGSGTLLRAAEIHTMRAAAAVGGTGTWCMEIGLHAEVAGATVTDNVGIHLTSYDWPAVGYSTAVRADTGYFVGGARGWKHGFLYQDTDGATTLFDVSQTGQVTSGSHLSLATDTYDLGSSANRWRAVYTTALVAESGGAAGPTIAFRTDTTTGLFLQANNVLGITTGGTEALRITSAGLLDIRRNQTVALGAGSTATLGTAGGSGPTNAAQSAWLKMLSVGSPIYLAYWV